LLTAGDVSGAGRVVDEALEIEAAHPGCYRAEVHRLHGRVLAATGGPAEAAYRKAIELARGQHSPMLELRAVADLAAITRDPGPARELLAKLTDAAGEPDVAEIAARVAAL
jgi:hypothetical protein